MFKSYHAASPFSILQFKKRSTEGTPYDRLPVRPPKRPLFASILSSAIHLTASQHPSRRLVKRQNIHLTASQKWQIHPSHRLVKSNFKRAIEKFSICPLFRLRAESPEPQKTPQLQAFSALPLCHQCHALNVVRFRKQVYQTVSDNFPSVFLQKPHIGNKAGRLAGNINHPVDAVTVN